MGSKTYSQPASYITLWNQERCKLMRKQKRPGQPLNMLFGGPHLSEPSFRRFGVKTGDVIYPIAVADGLLFILGQMRVTRLISLEEYIEENPTIFAGHHSQNGVESTFGNWQSAHPEFRYLAPTCTNEVALGEGYLLEQAMPVPVEELENLRFCSKRGVRGLNNIEGGRLKSTLSISGAHFRLNEDSALRFDSLSSKSQNSCA